MRNRFVDGWPGGMPETPCGVASTRANTCRFRLAIDLALERTQARVVNDAGCGDGNWMRDYCLPEGVTWRGFDIVLREAPFPVTGLDIFTATMPKADLVVCRDVLFHYPDFFVVRALQLFARCAPWLLATSHTSKVPRERDIDPGGFARIDLCEERYGLGVPALSVAEPKFERALMLWRL